MELEDKLLGGIALFFTLLSFIPGVESYIRVSNKLSDKNISIESKDNYCERTMNEYKEISEKPSYPYFQNDQIRQGFGGEIFAIKRYLKKN